MNYKCKIIPLKPLTRVLSSGLYRLCSIWLNRIYIVNCDYDFSVNTFTVSVKKCALDKFNQKRTTFIMPWGPPQIGSGSPRTTGGCPMRTPLGLSKNEAHKGFLKHESKGESVVNKEKGP